MKTDGKMIDELARAVRSLQSDVREMQDLLDDIVLHIGFGQDDKDVDQLELPFDDA